MNDYFALRGVDASSYPPSIAAYIRPYLPDKESKIVDIGCGYGQVLRCLKKEGYGNLSGIDVNADALAYLHECGIQTYNNIPEKLFEDCRAAIGGARLVIMQHILEHLPKEKIIEALATIRTSLDDNGQLLVSVPNAQSHTGCYWAYEDFTHNTLFTAGSLLFVLKAAGYGNVRIIDADCTEGLPAYKKRIKKMLLSFYRQRTMFWNKVTSSSFHRQSPHVFSYEVKAIASKAN